MEKLRLTHNHPNKQIHDESSHSKFERRFAHVWRISPKRRAQCQVSEMVGIIKRSVVDNWILVYIYIYIYIVFANSPGNQGSIPDWLILKIQKCYLITPCLTPLHYKVRIKDKVKQPWERRRTLSLYLGVVFIEKGARGSRSTTLLIYVCDGHVI